MSNVRRVASNVAFLYAAHFVNAVRVILMSILIARELGGDVFGQYSFAIAFTSIFAFTLNWGLTTVIVRDVPRNKSLAPKYLGNITIIKIIMSVVVFGLILLTIELMDYPGDVVIAVLIIGLSTIFISFGDIFNMIFRVYERMGYEALASIIGSIFVIGLTVLALLLDYGLVGVACAVAIGSGMQFLISFLVCIMKFTRPKLEIDLVFWKKVMKAALPITFLSIAGVLYTRTDTVMLSSMKGDVAVGMYAAANTLILGLRPVPILFMQALFPSMTVFAVTSRDSLKASYERSHRYVLMVAIPLSAGSFLLAHRIIPLFYGGDFGQSVLVLQILSAGIVLFFTGGVLSNVLVAIDKQNVMAVFAVGCGVINVILNVLLIPRYSYIGAAASTVITEALLCVAYFSLVSAYLYRPPFYRIVAKPLVACLGMGIFIYVCSDISLVVVVATAVLIYFGLLYLIRGFSKNDITIMKKAIGIHRGA